MYTVYSIVLLYYFWPTLYKVSDFVVIRFYLQLEPVQAIEVEFEADFYVRMLECYWRTGGQEH